MERGQRVSGGLGCGLKKLGMRHDNFIKPISQINVLTDDIKDAINDVPTGGKGMGVEICNVWCNEFICRDEIYRVLVGVNNPGKALGLK